MRCSNEDQISDGSKLKMSNGDPETVSPTGAPENLASVEAPSCGEIPNGATLSKPNREVPLKAAESVGFCEGQENLAQLQAPSSEKISDIDTLRKVDGETPLRESGTVISSEGRENLVSLEAPSSVEIPDGSNLSKVDEEVPLRKTVIANSGEGQENLVSAEALSSEEIPDGAALGKAVGDIHLRASKTVNSGGGKENLVSLEAPSSGEIPDGTTLSNFDGEVQLRAPETVSSGEGYENLLSLVEPSSEEILGRTTLNMADGELPLSGPEAFSTTEGQRNIMSANCSFEKQNPGGATLNMPDGEVPKSTSEIATSSDGMDIVCMNPSTSKEQIPDTAARSMPAEEVSLAEPETAPSEVPECGSVHRENDGTSPIEIDQLDGVLCTTNQESEFEEPSLAGLSSVHPVPTTDQGGPLPPDLVAETSPFNGAIDVTCNVSNPDASVVELREQMQQLRSTESTSNLSPPDLPSVGAIEHQPSNEGQTDNQNSHAPRQPVANHIELSSQDVLQPMHSPIDGLVRQASETRTASGPSVSNGLPLQTAPAVSSRIPLPLYHDPLQNEMERIRKEKEQTFKVHEDTKLQLKSECEKEIEEIRRKYEVKFQEKEAEFLLKKKELDVNYNKVLLNKILAEAFRSKCMDNRTSGSAGAQQEGSSSFMQQLVQLSSQQMVQQPSTASGLPSTGSATSMQTVSPAVVNAQTMGPPLQVVNPSALFSGTPTRPPHINSISPSTGNLQMGTEIRAPAPHLHPFRPSSSISPTSLPLNSRGMLSQQAHNNHPVASMSLRQSYGNLLAHRQASTTGQSGRIQHEIAGGLAALPNSSLLSLDVLMGINNLSGANANPPSNLLPDVSSSLATLVRQESRMPSIRSNSAQQSRATDIVCLSDDD